MSEERLISHDARIAGVVAVFVAIAELAISEWIHEAYHRYPLWTIFVGVVAILVLFFLVFLVIRSYERWWHSEEASRKEAAFKEPIKLRNCGIVDGIWVDAIYDIQSKKRVEGSVIKIESRGDGFSIEGWAFDNEAVVNTDNVNNLAQCGHWSGSSRHWTDNGFVYAYEGGKDVRQRDKGAVVYEFIVSGGRELRMEGIFFGFGLQTAYYIQGKRIDSNSKTTSSGLRREKLTLQNFLRKEQANRMNEL